jgi:3-methyl-2-oxobutanoate hydroxymethyltransferase
MDRSRTKVTVPKILASKHEGRPLVMLTAYDATFARLADSADVDILLVGDSLGMVVQGHQDTLPVTLDEMIYHTRCVSRVTKYAQVILDLPFMSYQESAAQAVAAAGRAMKEGRAHGVKLEGGISVAGSIERIVAAGIPVMGHVGLMPQSVHAIGGFKVQGRDEAARARIMEDARAVEQAGAFCLVLEGIPSSLAAEITQAVQIPTIGIGAGVACDGQVLVMHDLLGLDDGFKPRFVKRYAELAAPIRAAFQSYADEVRARAFPTEAQSFGASPMTSKATTGSAVHQGSERAEGYGPSDGDGGA